MLSFTAPRSPLSLVVKSGATIRPGDRLSLGRQASLILPRLYLSNLFTARDRTQLFELGVTHVLSVVEDAPKLPQDLGLQTLHVPIKDEVGVDILGYLEETTEWIKAALAESGNSVVLVHCLVGMSRSATVVCAYIMAAMNMTPSDAIGFVASKRCIVSPNIGFRKQLEQYYVRLHPNATRPRPQHKLSAGFAKLRSWRSPVIPLTTKSEPRPQVVQASSASVAVASRAEGLPRVVDASITIASSHATATEQPLTAISSTGQQASAPVLPHISSLHCL